MRMSEGRRCEPLEVRWPFPQRSSRPWRHDSRIQMRMSEGRRCEPFEDRRLFAQRSSRLWWHDSRSLMRMSDGRRCEPYHYNLVTEPFSTSIFWLCWLCLMAGCAWHSDLAVTEPPWLLLNPWWP